MHKQENCRLSKNGVLTPFSWGKNLKLFLTMLSLIFIPQSYSLQVSWSCGRLVLCPRESIGPVPGHGRGEIKGKWRTMGSRFSVWSGIYLNYAKIYTGRIDSRWHRTNRPQDQPSLNSFYLVIIFSPYFCYSYFCFEV